MCGPHRGSTSVHEAMRGLSLGCFRGACRLVPTSAETSLLVKHAAVLACSRCSNAVAAYEGGKRSEGVHACPVSHFMRRTTAVADSQEHVECFYEQRQLCVCLAAEAQASWQHGQRSRQLMRAGPMHVTCTRCCHSAACHALSLRSSLELSTVGVLQAASPSKTATPRAAAHSLSLQLWLFRAP